MPYLHIFETGNFNQWPEPALIPLCFFTFSPLLPHPPHLISSSPPGEGGGGAKTPKNQTVERPSETTIPDLIFRPKKKKKKKVDLLPKVTQGQAKNFKKYILFHFILFFTSCSCIFLSSHCICKNPTLGLVSTAFD